MMGFKSFASAAATLAGIELAHMIRKGQLGFGGTVALSWGLGQFQAFEVGHAT